MIVKDHSYKTFAWSKKKRDHVLVDVMTANMLLTVHDALTREETKAIFIQRLTESKVSFVSQVERCWKLFR